MKRIKNWLYWTMIDFLVSENQIKIKGYKFEQWKLPLTIGFIFGIISLLFFVVIGVLLIIN